MSDQTPINEPSGIESARAAKERMKKLNREVTEQWPDVLEAAETLYELRKRNHFAELIMDAMGKK